jgi:hypothetical protein
MVVCFILASKLGGNAGQIATAMGVGFLLAACVFQVARIVGYIRQRKGH